MWASELTDCANGPKADVDEGIVAPPTRWMRTGPGYANDGRLKYDLTQFDQSYFDPMRARTIMAGENGIYVSVMLFNGFEFQFETNEKDGDPFRDVNNINNIRCSANCPADSSQMSDAVWSVEKAYIRKVIDTVNDLDNVLYGRVGDWRDNSQVVRSLVSSPRHITPSVRISPHYAFLHTSRQGL
jgi:hypothetical protein